MITDELKLSQELWNACDKLNPIDGVQVEEGEWMYPDFSFRVYTNRGHCFDVLKEHMCDPEDLEDYQDQKILSDGCVYSFITGHFDGFKEIDIEEALKLFTA